MYLREAPSSKSLDERMGSEAKQTQTGSPGELLGDVKNNVDFVYVENSKSFGAQELKRSRI